jgi:hypothetical protein
MCRILVLLSMYFKATVTAACTVYTQRISDSSSRLKRLQTETKFFTPEGGKSKQIM